MREFLFSAYETWGAPSQQQQANMLAPSLSLSLSLLCRVWVWATRANVYAHMACAPTTALQLLRGMMVEVEKKFQNIKNILRSAHLVYFRLFVSLSSRVTLGFCFAICLGLHISIASFFSVSMQPVPAFEMVDGPMWRAWGWFFFSTTPTGVTLLLML